MASKGSSERKTKAGMLKDENDSAAASEQERKPENEKETTPKISKAKPEGQHDDKPVH